jgi:protein-disulfide isomerase
MSKKDQNRMFTWLFAAVIIFGSFLWIMFNGGNSSDPISDDGSVNIPELSENEWVKGNAESDIVLIEYSDFQCPACKSALPTIEGAVSEFSNHIKFVYRQFPLRSIHPNAQITAQASEAAGLQGKFWEMHDILFENQSNWKDLNSSEIDDVLVGYAGEIGINSEQFADDLRSSDVEKAVNEDYDGADRAKLRGTPTLILNGKIANPSASESLRDIIRAEIESAETGE